MIAAAHWAITWTVFDTTSKIPITKTQTKRLSSSNSTPSWSTPTEP